VRDKLVALVMAMCQSNELLANSRILAALLQLEVWPLIANSRMLAALLQLDAG
jgi:hypothetical protein